MERSVCSRLNPFFATGYNYCVIEDFNLPKTLSSNSEVEASELVEKEKCEEMLLAIDSGTSTNDSIGVVTIVPTPRWRQMTNHL